MHTYTCCFVGHREINESERLTMQIYSLCENLILKENINTFLFGSKSRFNSLCYQQVSLLKEKYPHIKRIYVRAEFPYIDDGYKDYLLQYYEDTYFPESAINSGRAVYVKRNRDMINKSRYCVFYCCYENLPKKRKSGTRQALDYAISCKKDVILLPF